MINQANQPSVSIIIPIYNIERYLSQCLDSVIAQTLKNIEIICVNDGSTDNSLNILKEYAEKDNRIKIISQPNGGYGKAVNNGILSACGKYIGIFEPDDLIKSDMYKTLYHIAEKYSCDIVKADFYRFTGDGEERKETYVKTAISDENYNRIINPSVEKSCFKFVMNTWSGIYNRNFIIENNILHNETPGASYQDNGFWFKGFCLAKRIMFVDKPFYMNRRDNPNSSVYNRNKIYCVNTEYDFIYEFLNSNPELKENFIGVYSMKKFHNYMFTLRRIAPKFRHEYILRISEEFRNANSKNELIKEFFTAKEWTELNILINDPEEYFYTVEREKIKVSVILPVYNSAKYLEQCLDSIVSQTLKDIEIICINDGSTDNSGEILEKYASSDPRFIIINTTNNGAGRARNIGIDQAEGKYLYFPDSDDWLEKDALMKVYQMAECHHANIAIFRSLFYDNNTGDSTSCTFSIRSDMLPTCPFNAKSINNSIFRCLMGWAWDKLFLRSFVLSNGLRFQEQRTTNDLYFVFISMFKASCIVICYDYLYHQRRNVTGSLSMTREKSWNCFYNALIAVRNEMKEMGIYETYKSDFVDYALHFCLWNLNTLNESAGKLLFEKLRSEWLSELGISDACDEWFTNKTEYKNLCLLKDPNIDYSAYKNAQATNKTSAKSENSAKKKFNANSSKSPEYWRRKYESIRKSYSYRIGRIITWLPRKIKHLFKK